MAKNETKPEKTPTEGVADEKPEFFKQTYKVGDELFEEHIKHELVKIDEKHSYFRVKTVIFRNGGFYSQQIDILPVQHAVS